ncbi:MAG: hypothetical protein FJW21_00045 [Acidimicrobiia bacterium]|nr:hypothetical protein [Acidimicrobiia bacterium]
MITILGRGHCGWRRLGVCALCLTTWLAALTIGAQAQQQTTKASAERHRGHHHEAPHGGTLVEIGDHFAFLEFVHDSEAGSLTLYVLDGSAEKAVRITQPSVMFMLAGPGAAATPLELKARARAITGETVGDTSEFVAISDLLKGLRAGRGTVVQLSIKGQTLKDLAVKWPDDEHQ